MTAPAAHLHHRKLLVLLALVTAGTMAVPAAAATASTPSPMFVRVGPKPAVPAGSKRVSLLPGSADLHVDVTLEPRDPAGLATYAQDVSTPGSSLYRHYLAHGQFASLFGPTPASIQAVRATLRAEGLRAGPVSADGIVIPVSASAAALSRAFSTGFAQYRLPGGRVAYANLSAPSIPSAISSYVQGIVGLDDLAVPTPGAVSSRAQRTPSALPQPRIDTGGPQACPAAADDAGSNGPYTADDIASAYGYSSLYGAGDLGSGQTVAVMEFEPNLPSDITSYEDCYGLTTSVTYVRSDGGAGRGKGSGEAALDIEDISGLAPDVNIVDYQAPNTNAGWIDNWTTAISDDEAKVISDSWGECEPETSSEDVSTENTLFEQAAAQGQSIVVAAGDSGSQDCLDAWEPISSSNDADELAVDDPGAQPYVTDVGGTSLESAASSPAETVWNDGQGGGAGGGGISENWTMPSYQADASSSVGVINAYSSGTPCRASSGEYCREVPDVAADADPYSGYLIYWDASWDIFGGTSLAAPDWAALLALTDASAACGSQDVGFANPDLYGVAATEPSAFNDITVGNNDVSGLQHGLYPALRHYDMASGLGTPNSGVLSAALCAATGLDPVKVTNPGPQTTDVGEPTSIQVVAKDSTAGQTLTYSALGLPPGLSIGASTGLISGAATGSGLYEATVTAADGSGASDSVTFAISVPASITSIAPGYGPSSGGTKVVIHGLGFTGTTQVLFGGSPASFSVGSLGKSITASAPGGTGTVTVTVIGPAGTSPSSAAALFDYGPTIHTLSPHRGRNGTKVVIEGTNLSGATAVLFGTDPASRIVSDGKGRIVALAPNEGAGSVVVTVTTPGGTSPSVPNDVFTYS